jgi:hypothetical protein
VCLYKAAIRHRLENQANLWLFQQAVDDLMVQGDRVVGAVTQLGIRFAAQHGGADGRARFWTARCMSDWPITRPDAPVTRRREV